MLEKKKNSGHSRRALAADPRPGSRLVPGPPLALGLLCALELASVFLLGGCSSQSRGPERPPSPRDSGRNDRDADENEKQLRDRRRDPTRLESGRGEFFEAATDPLDIERESESSIQDGQSGRD
jgi:hypothetical protein